MTVGKWRKRAIGSWAWKGCMTNCRPGRPRTYEDDTVAEVINRALQTKPADGSTQWSARSLAAATGISENHRSSLVADLLSAAPQARSISSFSTDPFFVEKVRDIVGSLPEPTGQGDGPLRR